MFCSFIFLICKITLNSSCSGIPKTAFRFDGLLGGLRVLGLWSHSRLWLITLRRYKTKSSKGKNERGRIGGQQAQTSRSPLPVESHRAHLPSLAPKCDDTCEMPSTREAWLSLQIHGFCWQLAMWSPSACPLYQNSRFPERKQVFSINHTVCTNV